MTNDMLHRKKRNSGQKSDVEVQLTTGLANQLLRHIVYVIFTFHPTTIINVHVHGCAVLLCLVGLFDLACFFLSSFIIVNHLLKILIETCVIIA